jgi:hypothetical protein
MPRQTGRRYVATNKQGEKLVFEEEEDTWEDRFDENPGCFWIGTFFFIIVGLLTMIMFVL